MSLTSYRAAPPRARGGKAGGGGRWALGQENDTPTAYGLPPPACLPNSNVVERKVPFFAGLATTYSPVS